jgi:hypothetical protein
VAYDDTLRDLLPLCPLCHDEDIQIESVLDDAYDPFARLRKRFIGLRCGHSICLLK